MKIPALIIVIAAMGTLTVAWAQQKSNAAEEQARAELAAVLAARDEAAEKKDLERFFSFYAADFTWRLEGGRTLTRQETEQLLRLVIGGDILEHKQRSTIKSAKVRGNEVVLNVQTDSVVKQRLRDGSIKEETGSGERRETWVKAGGAWNLKLIDKAKTRELQTTINGQKVDPLKAPSDPPTPAPNAEDQTVLEAGHALVFVYRLNDGTVVKTPVYCDDVSLAEMTGGSFIKVKLMPGKHFFHSEKGSAIEINLESSKIYFLVIDLKAGFPKGRGVLTVDTSGTGPTAYKLPRIMDLRPLGRDNVRDVSRVIVGKQ